MNTVSKHLRLFLIALALFSGPLTVSSFAQDTMEKTKEEIEETTKTIGERFQESRLVNREPADLIGWVFMGALVGALAGTFSPLGTTVSARIVRLLLGLAGALIGGTIVRLLNLDFGWPIIEIPLVELLFSLLGAIVLVFLIRGGSRYIKHKNNPQP